MRIFVYYLNIGIRTDRLQSAIMEKFSTINYRIGLEELKEKGYFFVARENIPTFFNAFRGAFMNVIVGMDNYPISSEIINKGIIQRFIVDLELSEISYTKEEIRDLIADMVFMSGKASSREQAIDWVTDAMDDKKDYLRHPENENDIKALEAMEEGQKTAL